MKKISIIFFDIDGTLLDNKTHQVSIKTKNALISLKRNGIKVVISTGRNLEDLQDLGLSNIIDWDGYICRNGADNYDQDQNSISCHYFPTDVSTKLNEVSLAKQIPLMITSSDDRYMNMENNENVINAFDYFHKKIPAIKAYQQEPVIMVLAFGQENYDYADFKIKGATVMPGISTFADIVIDGCSKFIGVSSICKHYCIPLDETMAFGDALNDIEMVEGCSLGVAMGQGHVKLKAIADYITDTVDEDGIYNALTHFQLI